MGWTFPRDDSTPTLQCTERGTPHNFNIGGFPAGDPSWMDKIGQLWSGKRKWFYAKIHSVVGGNTYKVIELGAVVKGVAQVRGQLITAIWLKPRSYDPPMGVGTWVVATYDRDKRCVFTGKSTDAILGEVRMYQGAAADVPTGWYLCNLTNAATTKNGITVVNFEDCFIVASGLRDGDTYDVGDTGGATTHTHDTHAAHDASHNHGFTVTSTTRQVDNNGDGAMATVVDSAGPAPGSTTADGGSLTHAAHSAANHLPPYYALAFMVFAGV